VVAWFALQAARLAWFKGYSLDEMTYAHASWAIAQGQVPFRDFFAHHTPLLLQLGAPAFLLVGDDAAALRLLRLGMLASVGGACVASAVLLRAWGWGALLAVGFLVSTPLYAVLGTEFRPDGLAFSLWLAAVALLGAERWRPFPRALVAGALTIVAVWASEKVLVYGAGFAVALVVDLVRPRRERYLLADPWGFVIGAALALVPIVASLVATGSSMDFARNFLSASLLHERHHPGIPWSTYLGPFVRDSARLLPLALVGVVAALRGEPRRLAGGGLLAAGLALSLTSFLVQRAAYPYSLIPFAGLLALFAAHGTWTLAAGAVRLRQRPLRAVAIAALVAYLLPWWTAAQGELSLQQGRTRAHQERVLQLLDRLLEREDPVYDNAGAAIGRPHVRYEYFTNHTLRTRYGERLAREVPRSIEAAGCTAWMRERRTAGLPAELQEYLEVHFQPYSGDLYLWGSRYDPRPLGSVEASFLAVRPGRYFVHPPEVLQEGVLEVGGRPVETREFTLEGGRHQVRYAGRPRPFFLLWLPRDGKRWRPQPGRATYTRLF
jgi:hypothetical protein